MKTYVSKEKDFNAKMYLIDAAGKTLGRLAVRVARLLLGKDKVIFTPDQICGDQVIVINAEKIHVSGRKTERKVYTHYTGYPGGLRQYSLEELLAKKPTEVITRAVSRMLPHTHLGERLLTRLRVYAGPDHQHQAQKPIKAEV